MFRTLLIYFILLRLRRSSPEMFDGSRALAAINACIAEELAAYQPLGEPGSLPGARLA
ncbi:MAG: hypothetical protein M3016_08465 [Actinomycetota bacterium]|nr:hypothetical protein [Actinomycetota bacterium]